MYLLYCDESGSTKDPRQNHFLFSGVSVFERQSYWIASELDKLAAQFNPADPGSVEFHGNVMHNGSRGIWRSVAPARRLSAMQSVLDVLVRSHPTNRIFVCVVRKAKISPKDPVEETFMQLSNRFDRFLLRLHRAGDSQRGVIIFDKSTYEATIQSLATDFRTIGHRWGILRNLAEVPLFIDSRASRLIQLADLVAYSAFRHYERNDSQFFATIRTRIDSVGGTTHGLYEDI
jgi:hypothetical protein